MNPSTFKIVFLSVILLFFGLFATMPTNESENSYTKYCRIDSIMSKPRYEVMPQLDYLYYTACGLIPAGNTKHEVSDSIEITIKIIK